MSILKALWPLRTAEAPAAEEPPPPAAVRAADVSQGPFRALVESLPDPVLVIEGDPDEPASRRIVFANAAARDLLPGRLEGMRLVTALRNPELLEAVDEALLGAPGSAQMEAGGAQERIWAVQTRPLGQGNFGRLALLTLRDETDVRRAERMRVDFLANASHELRTPLASLSGFIETLRGHAKDDEQARETFLGIMQAQAERMRRLIDDLMSLSRIELNEHIAPEGRLDLALAVTDVLDALVPLVREKNLCVSTQMPARGAADIDGDRDQILQVIQNLVENAVKYSGNEGALSITVSAPVADDSTTPALDPAATRITLLAPDRPAGRRFALLRVTDQGPGIPRDRLPRLTERFYRVEGQKSGGTRPGTGLGLAIVKHIVNRHRGGMAVESAEGRGASFSVWLPLAEKEAT
ncbi:ATP-binding protein [Caulobacter sp. NIBR1757]|uniref:ATP-binding protein n=1 Tax=Caulobacter sp. NIBR1757 TaxID=3016000 RepID=UPI0022EFF10E|nr:ATP-binding protein [Caulobacter sp. NIBR1757]WGM37548.1 Phosphate regulon sensor protein PhoR [Caulobacter sp. NIBR1757]